MTAELKKRIVTSIILFILLIVVIFSHVGFFITTLIVISYFVYKELNFINSRILKKRIFLLNTLTIIYIFGIFSSSSIILYNTLGPMFVFYILLICIFSDIGGYIVGKIIGGKKLTKISPNKTISGSIGSFFISILPLLIFIIFEKQEYIYINSFIFCLFISLVCQLGDLFISYLKRKANVKDTGKVLPGHGGILDRIDGIIFAIPLAYSYVTLLNYYSKSLS